MYACNQPATFSPAILLLLHLALLISYPSPIPSYPPCSHIYGMVCFLLPFPAACYAHITRLGPRSCCCRLARQTRREPGRIRRGKEQEQACLVPIFAPLPSALQALLLHSSPSPPPPLAPLCVIFHFLTSHEGISEEEGTLYACLPTRLRGYAMAGLILTEYCLWLWPKDDPC